MNKKGMGAILWMLFLLVVTVGLAVQTNPDFDVELFKEKLEWSNIDLNIYEQPELEGAIEDATNGLGSAAFGIARWGSDYAKDNPTIPWKFLTLIILLSISIPIIIGLIKIGAIIFILIREYFQLRKEKKEVLYNG
ncbi:hypothetical protein LCGC14_0979940 [marine sediment metagenome]|uniref:Uncharacterized protein n=1 Tax=marine sediment metagenome TaxID=412755 RepID=A0A0F9NVA7_9ZZZZ